jgi:hypothetical protein
MITTIVVKQQWNEQKDGGIKTDARRTKELETS